MNDGLVFAHHPSLYFLGIAIVSAILALLIWPWKPRAKTQKDSNRIRPALSKLKWFLLAQKFRIDLGFQFLTLVNFSLLVVTASSGLRSYMSLPSTATLVAIAVPLAFFGMWLFGFFLDRVVRYQEALAIQLHKRNPIGDDLFASLNRIEQKLDRLGG